MQTGTEIYQGNKLRHYRFKDSIQFDSVEQAQDYIDQNGGSFRLNTDTTIPLSGIINGNCIILECTYPVVGKQIGAYFIGALGHVERIRLSGEHAGNLSTLTAWLDSDEFRQNKYTILAKNPIPQHELDGESVLHICDNNKEHIIYRWHVTFMKALEEFEYAKYQIQN